MNVPLSSLNGPNDIAWLQPITSVKNAVAAFTSTLSTPMPARPITFSRVAFSRIFAVALVADRIARKCGVKNTQRFDDAEVLLWTTTRSGRHRPRLAHFV